LTSIFFSKSFNWLAVFVCISPIIYSCKTYRNFGRRSSLGKDKD